MATALAPFKPRFRDFAENLSFVWDERTLQNGTNSTLKTALGEIDLLGEVLGIGNFHEVEKLSHIETLYDRSAKILSVDGLILAKKAAGQTKDLLVLPELEALKDFLDDQEQE